VELVLLIGKTVKKASLEKAEDLSRPTHFITVQFTSLKRIAISL